MVIVAADPVHQALIQGRRRCRGGPGGAFFEVQQERLHFVALHGELGQLPLQCQVALLSNLDDGIVHQVIAGEALKKHADVRQ